jgi:hypothetical protein
VSNFIDKLFREKLQNRSFKPQAGDWEAMSGLIDSNLNGAANTSFSFNWLLIGALSLLIIAGTYIGFQAEKDYGTTSTNKNVTKISMESNSKNGTIKQEESYPLTFQEQNKNIDNDSPLIDAKEVNLNNSKNPSNSNDPSNSNNNFLSKYSAQNSIYNKANERTTIVGKKDNPPSTKNINGTNYVVYPPTNSASKIGTNLNVKEDNSIQKKNNSVFVYVDKKENTESDEEAVFASTPQQTQNNNREYEFDDYLNAPLFFSINSKAINYLPYNSERPSILELTNDHTPVQKTKAIKAKRNLPFQLSIAALAEISIIGKSLKGTNEYASLIDIRNTQEKNIIGFGGGLEAQIKYKNWGFSSGLIINRWGENVQYEEKYYSEWDITSETNTDTLWTEDIIFTIDTVWNPLDSNYTIIIDSSYITTIDTILTTIVYDSTETITDAGLSSKNGKTKIQYWEIPLYFSYQFDVGDFYLSPGLGITIGFLKITRGYYMAENLESLIPINTGYSVIRKTHLNGQINLGIGYRLGDRFSIEATPSFKFNLTNIFENPDMIQKYSKFSLQFRLRYYF